MQLTGPDKVPNFSSYNDATIGRQRCVELSSWSRKSPHFILQMTQPSVDNDESNYLPGPDKILTLFHIMTQPSVDYDESNYLPDPDLSSLYFI